jgi:hypothetical protein
MPKTPDSEPSSARQEPGGTEDCQTPRDGDCPAAKKSRFGEPLKFLPVVFVVFSIGALWFIYVLYHCVPMLQLGVGVEKLDQARRIRGTAELVIFHCFTIMLSYCYVMSIIVHPGQIPENDPQWEYLPQDGRMLEGSAPLSLQETKKSGDRRHCKWCGKYKPDRAHHCRVCKTCILKMDHHCPWIYNCVGFANYKYFFLLLFYSVLDCHLIVWTMPESCLMAVRSDTLDFHHMFFIFFGEALAFFIGVLTTVFFLFHNWLVIKALTTIEYCEKSLPKKDENGQIKSGESASPYDLGLAGNYRSILGPNPFGWLLPFAQPTGDGLNFVTEDTRLTIDMETGRGMRKKIHQKTQRMPLRRMRGGVSGEETPPSGARTPPTYAGYTGHYGSSGFAGGGERPGYANYGSGSGRQYNDRGRTSPREEDR